jgi:hypothetical protein
MHVSASRAPRSAAPSTGVDATRSMISSILRSLSAHSLLRPIAPSCEAACKIGGPGIGGVMH